jgi:DNA-binding NtrC family response regulator/ligand-binding sensor domain-containing protein
MIRRDAEMIPSDGAKPERKLKVYGNADPTSSEAEIIQLKQGIWRTYDATDGLPGGVGCLLQDQHGYLWLGTSVEARTGTGLCRYDGSEFIVYTTEHGLAHNRVISICEDHKGRLWLGTPRGVSCYDGQQFTNYTAEDGLAGSYVYAISEDRLGRLWFGTRASGASCFDGRRFTNYTADDGLIHNGVSAIHEDRQGHLWFATKGVEYGGICRFDGQDFVTYTPTDGLAHSNVYTICEDRQGRLWFGTNSGVSCFDGHGFINYTTVDGLGNDHVYTICEDRQGTMWFGFEHRGSGVSQLIEPEQSQGGKPRFINYTTDHGLLDNEVYDIIQDQEGHLWFAHSHSGVTNFDSETMQLLTGVPVSQILIQDTEERLWFGNSNELCRLRLNASHMDPVELYRQNFNAIIFGLVEDANGEFWIGTQGDGIYHYNSCDAVWHGSGENFTTQNGLSNDAVLSLLETRDGVIWAGTWADAWIFGNPACLCRYKGEEFEAIPTSHPVIRRLFEDSCGRIWMGGWFGGGLSCYDGETLVTYTEADGLPNDSVQSIVEDDDGNLWIGTLQGLCCFDGERFTTYGEERGLTCLYHQWSAKDAAGHLWFGTLMGGLYRYDGEHFQQLTEADGLPSNCVTGLIPQSDGSMIIGTYHGIIYYRSTAIIPPQVEIREVIADEVYRNQTELDLTTTGADLLTISYHGLSLATRQMRYSYILEGYDEEWQDTWENQVRYEHLPAGEYTFKVIAINRDLVSSESPATLELKVVPDPRDAKISVLQSEVNHLRREVGAKYDFKDIVGQSDAIKQVQIRMERAIESGLNVVVLVTGETGTGKELVAKAIHFNSSRKDGPLRTYNCAAIPRELIGSELFGHRKGAFTGAIEDRRGYFEAAEGGTLILDEIGDMPLDAQAHLLRVLEDRKIQRIGEHTSRDVNVRIIAMTNRDLKKEVDEGRFREDLYYRLNEFPIHLPLLRERLEDIPILAEHFLQRYSDESVREMDGFAPGVFELLQSYPWPGNVRELQSAIHSSADYAVHEGTRIIQIHHAPSQITHGRESLDLFKRRLIEDALHKSGGNRAEAARTLGIHRPNLVEMIKRLGIETDR